jgi:DNA repair protein RecO (recombination protein O)
MSSQPRAYKTRGIVLRARNLGEADKIVTLFTTERGKVDAVAKGVRRAKSHLAGRLEFLSEALLGMHRGRNLDIIVSAEVQREHWRGIVEPAAFAAASVVAEIVDSFCEPDLALPEVYELLIGVIAAMASSPEPTALLPRFELRLLAALGLAPPVDVCVRCNAAFGEHGAWVDEEAGALAGEECRERWREAIVLDGDDLANFAALAAPRGAGATVRARPRVAEAVERLIGHHLGRRLKAGLHAAEFVGPKT